MPQSLSTEAAGEPNSWGHYKAQDYLAKAQESLAGADSELAHRRFNNCVRDAYYACFQAAIAALLNEEISR
jgi:uncharacterized protein (UPF0332 family)